MHLLCRIEHSNPENAGHFLCIWKDLLVVFEKRKQPRCVYTNIKQRWWRGNKINKSSTIWSYFSSWESISEQHAAGLPNICGLLHDYWEHQPPFLYFWCKNTCVAHCLGSEGKLLGPTPLIHCPRSTRWLTLRKMSIEKAHFSNLTSAVRTGVTLDVQHPFDKPSIKRLQVLRGEGIESCRLWIIDTGNK